MFHLLPQNKSEHLFTQLKKALTHLYSLKILPVDANSGNFLITKDCTLKLIDFDAWEDDVHAQKELGDGLYKIACSFTRNLFKDPFMNLPVRSNIQSEDDLAAALENLKLLAAKSTDPSTDNLYDDIYSVD